MMENGSKNDRFLDPIRIIDMADEKASFCSKLLADLGAEVIKVEKPSGDPGRRIGPFWKDTSGAERSFFFDYHNSNKRRITLDIGGEDDREILRRLIKRADILVETYSPGYLEKIGLGFEALNEINPRIILVSVTGFGQSGPRRNYKSCDLVASAFGGQMYVSGSPSGPPLKPFGEQSYYAVSLFAAAGILLALRKRVQSGKGEHLDISLHEAVTATLDHVMVRYFYDKTIPRRHGSRYWNDSFCILPCEDGYLQMTLLQQWETVVERMAGEGMAGDLTEERWKDDGYRLNHIDHVQEVASRWTEEHARSELFEMGQMMGFPWAPIFSPKDVLNSPQLKARRFFAVREDATEGSSLPYPGLPFRFGSLPLGQWKQAPPAGEAHDQIFQKEPGAKKESPQDCSSTMKVSRGILSGLRVLDFTWMVAGPYATRILADHGAEVIRVQSKRIAGGEGSNPRYFNTWNRNKRSITLDMSHPEARDLALKLAAISDVVVENFSPRVLSNWGLSYGELKKVKPDLIMASLSAMGQTGPWRDRVGFAPTLHALSGLTYLTSHTEDAPMGLGFAYLDPVMGLYGVLSILTSLEYRDRTGQGQYIDLSGFEAACALMGPALLYSSVHNGKTVPTGNRSDHIPAAPYGCYQCRGQDRWCVIAVFEETEWQGLCGVMGDPDWTREERFSTLERRRENMEEVDELIGGWTVQKSPEEVVESLQGAGVPAGVVQNAEDLAKDPQLIARNFFVHLNHPVLGDTFGDASPIRFKDDRAHKWKAAPTLGEDNRYVFLELLGLTESEFSSYVERKVIY